MDHFGMDHGDMGHGDMGRDDMCSMSVRSSHTLSVLAIAGRDPSYHYQLEVDC
jgi:hypothetical protein